MNNFSRISIIARHEFLAIAGKKSFIVMTILIPLLSLACFGLPYLMMQFNKGEIETVAVVDESGRFGKAITDNDEFRFKSYSADESSEDLREYYEKQGDMYAIVLIPADVEHSLKVDVFSRNAVRRGLQEHVADCLNDTITQARIDSLTGSEDDDSAAEGDADTTDDSSEAGE